MYIVERTDARVFEFEIDGKTYKAPSIASLPLGQAESYAEAATGGNDMAFATWVIDNLFPEEARDAVRSLTLDEARGLLQAYIKESAVSPGESQA